MQEKGRGCGSVGSLKEEAGFPAKRPAPAQPSTASQTSQPSSTPHCPFLLVGSIFTPRKRKQTKKFFRL